MYEGAEYILINTYILGFGTLAKPLFRILHWDDDHNVSHNIFTMKRTSKRMLKLRVKMQISLQIGNTDFFNSITKD